MSQLAEHIVSLGFLDKLQIYRSLFRANAPIDRAWSECPLLQNYLWNPSLGNRPGGRHRIVLHQASATGAEAVIAFTSSHLNI